MPLPNALATGYATEYLDKDRILARFIRDETPEPEGLPAALREQLASQQVVADLLQATHVQMPGEAANDSKSA